MTQRNSDSMEYIVEDCYCNPIKIFGSAQARDEWVKTHCDTHYESQGCTYLAYIGTQIFYYERPIITEEEV